MQSQELIPHLFRTEFSKITTALCKQFGIAHMAMAEDIASETFAAALESWPHQGIPEKPEAWLYTVAKNKARNYLKRRKTFTQDITGALKYPSSQEQEIDIDLSDKIISDSQLQMLFVICHPVIAAEAQIALALRILCGFGIEEIADAFLTAKETINKRLYRAREKLRTADVSLSFPDGPEVYKRLDAVLTTLYLLFNEGYYSERKDKVLRKDLCLEAMRLTYLLIDSRQMNLPAVNALMALMCFHASRFEARKDEKGDLVFYQAQDDRLWNKELIAKGAYYLHQASLGDYISRYHLEAGIAYWHTIKADTREKWENILQLYNQLLQLEYSPIAALNRTYALAKVKGNAVAISEAEQLGLSDNHYYFTLLAELYKESNPNKARTYLQKAVSLAKSQTDKQTLRKKMDEL